MAGTTYRRTVELMEAELGDELVALDAAGGRCFGFNAVAASVWRQLEQPKSFAELRDALVDEYDVEPEQCERELRELLDSLCGKALVARSAPSA